jgi:hypothetical protein
VKLTGTIIYMGKEYGPGCEAGEDVPEGSKEHPIDVDRLKRLGLVEGSKAPERPSRRASS